MRAHPASYAAGHEPPPDKTSWRTSRGKQLLFIETRAPRRSTTTPPLTGRITNVNYITRYILYELR